MNISVIIPLFNRAETVQRSLTSVAAQTYRDFEVIVVDDGSSDGSAEVAKAFGDSRVKVIRQNNGGPGAARNRGIAEAEAPVLAFLDADDEWQPEFLERSVSFLTKNDVAAVTHAWYDEPGGRSTVGMWRDRGIRSGVQQVDRNTKAALLVHMLAFMSPCSTVARTTAVRKWGGYYEKNGCRYAEDAYLWLRFLLWERVGFVLEPLARFYRNASGLSGNYRGMRPIEPFLEDPTEARECCPPELSALLEDFLCIRAMKTACVLAYWGQWREGRRLRAKFSRTGSWRLPWFFPAYAACTPMGTVVGRMHRMVSAVL